MIFNTMLGCLIFLFLLKLLYDVVMYFFHVYKHPQEKRKFPILSAIVFGGCCLFYSVALIFSYTPGLYSMSSIPPTATRLLKSPAPNTSMRLAFPECYHWSQVTGNLLNNEICVYGIIRNLNADKNTPTRIEFSDQPNTFFVYDTLFIYPDVRPGWCILVRGEVQKISNVLYLEITDGMDAGIPSKLSDCQ